MNPTNIIELVEESQIKSTIAMSDAEFKEEVIDQLEALEYGLEHPECIPNWFPCLGIPRMIHLLKRCVEARDDEK